MDRRVAFGLWVFSAFVFISACRPSNDFIITEKQNGQTIAVPVGREVRVRLIGNPSTGYSWEPGVLDTSFVGYLGGWQEPAVAPTPPMDPRMGMRVGRPEPQRFLFKPVRAGTTTIELRYRRPWEKGPPAETFRLTLRIR